MGTSFPVNIPDDCPFSLHNIPFGIFSTSPGIGLGAQRRAGVAIGNFVLELDVLVKHGLFSAAALERPLKDVFLEPDLNTFATFRAKDRSLVRDTIIEILSTETSILFTDVSLNKIAFVPLDQVQMHVPMKITDYTDSFSSLVHAQNVARPLGMPVTPAFFEYPMAYNGRLSSIAVSGSDIVRPTGFFVSDGAQRSTFQPTRKLDFEVELGAFISAPVPVGETVNAAEAANHIFGFVLLNDWSARDIQKYEMPPLGPFHSKGFITTISPWIVTLDALKRCQSAPPPSDLSTNIHPMLRCNSMNHGLYDIDLSVHVSRKEERNTEIVRTNLKDSYWSIFQMVAYQSSSGWGLNTGDLLAGGTVSSPAPEHPRGDENSKCATFGCLLEIFAAEHVLPDVGGHPMSWLEDGDTLTMEGSFRAADGKMAGFGGLTGLVVPARSA